MKKSLQDRVEVKESAPRKRCDWAQGSDLLARYHDSEWGTPLHDDLRHFEFLLLDGAQAGLSWRTILNKRENYSVAFDSFNPQKISRYKDAKINKLLADEGIVRNRLKIHSAIKNARVFLQIQKEFGSFDSYVWRFTGGKTKVNKWKTQCQMPARTKESDALSSDLKKRGMSFVGTTIIYAYMQSAGMVNDHLVSCFRHKECE